MLQIDAEAARKGLSDAQSALSSAQTDYDKAVATIGVEVYSYENHVVYAFVLSMVSMQVLSQSILDLNRYTLPWRKLPRKE